LVVMVQVTGRFLLVATTTIRSPGRTVILRP
jgi:hypothetical protein